MSKNTFDGGPFFPQPRRDTHGGIRLRDHIAIEAMKAIISNNAVITSSNVTSGKEQTIIAEIAYDLADAMLSAREPE